jgi:succinyl-diaminopimelate desuccinylase
MPHLGDNAVYKLARAIGVVERFDPGVPAHPQLGAPTANVGTVHGGINVNSVPDLAEATVDMRTVTGQDHAALRDRLPLAASSEGQSCRVLQGQVRKGPVTQ